MIATKKALLIMAANSIGNHEDIPSRALEALKEADLVVFEEDKIARQVLKRAKIHREYLKFSEHKQQETLDLVRDALKKGQTVLYMSDQGMPNLADPGREFLQIAYKLDSAIKVIPGPSSVTAAISACPFNMERFFYRGFLPQEKQKRLSELKSLSKLDIPVIILDAPYRLQVLLEDCATSFSSNAAAFLALDISGENEAYLQGDFHSLIKAVKGIGKKVNFVLIIEHQFV